MTEQLTQIFPAEKWEIAEPAALDFNQERLAAAGDWQAARDRGTPYRVLVVRHGRIAAEWNRGFRADEKLSQASASKSIYSCMLGVAVKEGKIGGADDRVVDYYPEMMDVPAGAGPKDGRYVFSENEGITFRQLIGNTSGYMKPGEAPGKVFHYQTFGMNVLTHAIATQYNLYKSADPERGAGFGKLAEWRIGNPIGASWGHQYTNFELPPRAKLGIFGYYTNFLCTARDMARLGLLWLHNGAWDGEQVVPSEWMREATRANNMVLENEPEENWKYGLGFWTNDKGKLWPELPRDSFAASGAGQQHIWVCSELELIVVQSPGIYRQADQAGIAAVIERVVGALT